MDPIIGLKAVLAELNRSFEQNHSSYHRIKDAARVIFSASSLIFALASFMQFEGAKLIAPFDGVVQAGLIGLYLGLIIICVILNLPGTFYLPFNPDWETLGNAFYGKSEENILMHQISTTIDAINIDKRIISKYVLWTKVAGVLLVLMVLLMIATIFIPRV